TTRPTTAEREGMKWPVSLRTARAIEGDNTWIFTDGSGAGWHAAVLVRPGVGERRICSWREPLAGNAGAELDAVILGLEHTRTNERVVFVSDYLWTAYYINGWRKVHKPYLSDRVITARTMLLDLRLRGAVFVHYGGGNGGPTDFSRLNKLADRLCRDQQEVDVRLDSAGA
ncbi:MAG TPA: hypothetical protein VFJ58_20605, partial [Armatimonadota bacterium]|nr:hypothetical protein [Armatimonadota bacterium]